MNEVEIVANTAQAINAAILARNSANWSVSQLEDKPVTDQVYLVFSKPCGFIPTDNPQT